MAANDDQIRERLAAYIHEVQWTGWMRYIMQKCVPNNDGSRTMPVWAVERWMRQMYTPFDALSVAERRLDIDEADKILAIIRGEVMDESKRDERSAGVPTNGAGGLLDDSGLDRAQV